LGADFGLKIWKSAGRVDLRTGGMCAMPALLNLQAACNLR